MATFDTGDMCLWCFEDTAPGSGKWVNRIPANRDMADVEQALEELSTPEMLKSVNPALYATLDGYMCDDCQDFDYDCAVCYKTISEEDDVYDADDTGHWHRGCLPRELWHPDILEDES